MHYCVVLIHYHCANSKVKHQMRSHNLKETRKMRCLGKQMNNPDCRKKRVKAWLLNIILLSIVSWPSCSDGCNEKLKAWKSWWCQVHSPVSFFFQSIRITWNQINSTDSYSPSEVLNQSFTTRGHNSATSSSSEWRRLVFSCIMNLGYRTLVYTVIYFWTEWMGKKGSKKKKRLSIMKTIAKKEKVKGYD